MFPEETVVQYLEEFEGRTIENPWVMTERFQALNLRVTSASVSLHFSQAPTASSLAAALQDIDRHSRRVATAFEQQVPPAKLFGRGVHLKPLADGLIVESAAPGSLDVEMTLGAIYTLVISNPISFALNLASLMKFGRVGVKALLLEGESRRASLRVAPTPDPSSAMPDSWSADVIEIPTVHGVVRVPTHMASMRLTYRGPDGTELTVEAEPDRVSHSDATD